MSDNFENACKMVLDASADGIDLKKLKSEIVESENEIRTEPYEMAKAAFEDLVQAEKQDYQIQLTKDDGVFSPQDRKAVQNHVLSADGALKLIDSGVIPQEFLDNIVRGVDGAGLRGRIDSGDQLYLDSFNQAMTKMRPDTAKLNRKVTAEDVCDAVVGALDSQHLPNSREEKLTRQV